MRKSVLVVEDEILVRFMIEDALEDAGYPVLSAGDGDGALEALQGLQDGLAVLVTDVNLGGPFNGWEVARRVRESAPEVGVVYVTGDSAHTWASQGVTGSLLIDKPFAPREVVLAVASLLKDEASGAPAA